VPPRHATNTPTTDNAAFYSRFLHHLASSFVHFLRCDSRPNDGDDAIEDVAGDAASQPHLFRFLCVLDRNHFDSIKREMLPKTVSRSRLPSIRCNTLVLW